MKARVVDGCSLQLSELALACGGSAWDWDGAAGSARAVAYLEPREPDVSAAQPQEPPGFFLPNQPPDVSAVAGSENRSNDLEGGTERAPDASSDFGGGDVGSSLGSDFDSSDVSGDVGGSDEGDWGGSEYDGGDA